MCAVADVLRCCCIARHRLAQLRTYCEVLCIYIYIYIYPYIYIYIYIYIACFQHAPVCGVPVRKQRCAKGCSQRLMPEHPLSKFCGAASVSLTGRKRNRDEMSELREAERSLSKTPSRTRQNSESSEGLRNQPPNSSCESTHDKPAS